MIDELNKGLHEARNQSIFALEILGTKESINQLLDEFADIGFIKEDDRPLDGDYVESMKSKMVDNVIGHYRNTPIKLIDAFYYPEDRFAIREKESLKTLYVI